jgi:hypothetical protein
MTPGALAAGIAAVFASALTLLGVLLVARWRLAEENIIKERAKWRDAVRSIISEAVALDAENVESRTTALRLWGEIAVRMNPEEDGDKDDRALVQAIASLVDPANRTEGVRRRILDLAATILKHDWERAKWEARGRPWEAEPEQMRSRP